MYNECLFSLNKNRAEVIKLMDVGIGVNVSLLSLLISG